jgi:hypothetical protein
MENYPVLHFLGTTANSREKECSQCFKQEFDDFGAKVNFSIRSTTPSLHTHTHTHTHHEATVASNFYFHSFFAKRCALLVEALWYFEKQIVVK